MKILSLSHKIDLKYFSIVFIVVLISCFIHEFGHYLTGIILGNKMTMTLNMASPVEGYSEGWHAPLVYSGGPILTILQAVIAFITISLLSQRMIVFVFLLEPVVLRIWPYLVSPFMNQDEAKIATYLDVSPWVLPLITWILLSVLAFFGARKMRVSVMFVLVTIFLILIAFQIILRANNFLI